MIEKKYSAKIRLEVSPDDAQYRQVQRGLKARFDEKLLQEHLPPTTGVLTGDNFLVSSLGKVIPESVRIALEHTEFVGVFGRVIEEPGWRGAKCLQYLYVWDYQAVPAHEADYEPIFVFVDGKGRHAIYDLVHYCTRRLDLGKIGADGPGLRMIPGWHSFLPDASIPAASLDRDIRVQPLTDQHLTSWWTIPDNEVKLKIDKYMLNPFLLEAPGHFMSSPDEESVAMCCTFLEIERAMAEFEDPRQGLVEGVRRALTKCVGLFALHRLPALIRILKEMNDLGILTLPHPIAAGLNIGAISEMLKGSFVSMTSIGSSLFTAWKSKINHNDE